MHFSQAIGFNCRQLHSQCHHVSWLEYSYRLANLAGTGKIDPLLKSLPNNRPLSVAEVILLVAALEFTVV